MIKKIELTQKCFDGQGSLIIILCDIIWLVRLKTMKSCYFLGVFSFLIVGIAGEPSLPSVDGVIEDILSQKVEEFRALMKTGDPELDIPVLAPFESDYFPNAFSFDGIIEWVDIWSYHDFNLKFVWLTAGKVCSQICELITWTPLSTIN